MPEADESFHRWGGDYLTRREVADAPPDGRRVALALGPVPVEHARHLLAPVPFPVLPEPEPPGPRPGVEFLMDATGSVRRTGSELRGAFSGAARRALGCPRLWVKVIGRSRDARWQPLEEVADHASASALALTWELAALLSPDWTDAARDLASFAAEAGRTAAPLGWSVAPREAPAEAAQRAVRLIALKDRFARSVEMRLLPQGRRFPARDVWRAAYALGMEWGDMDLFHWRETRSGKRLFTLSAVGGGTTYFLPERAAEGEAVAGLALSFELPLSPAPLATYDRMAVALDYLRQKLGGRPTAPDGAELDGDRLWSDRDALTDAVEEMTRAGIAPGSPEAARFF